MCDSKREDQVVALDGFRFDLELVRSHHKTLTALARSLGLSRTRISLVRSGWLPPPAMRAQIAEVLNVEPDDLWVSYPAGGGAG